MTKTKPEPRAKTWTLRELWDQANRKPVRVVNEYWEPGRWFQLMGVVPGGAREGFGYMETGHGIGFASDQQNWRVSGNIPVKANGGST